MRFEFSANLGFLWKDRPFLERIAAARAADFPFVEFHDDAQREDTAAVKAALGGTPLVGLNARMGETAGAAALPGEEETAKADITAAIETAEALGAGAIHVLSGKTEAPGSADRLAARLEEAAKRAPEIVFLIEPISAAAMPGYFLNTPEQAAEIIEQVGRSNVKILFDCFHVQRAGGDVIARFRTHAEQIGHVQIAGGSTRAEPDKGELDYRWLLPAFRDAGYDGPFGCEYNPTTTVEAGLSWRTAFI